MMIFCLPLLGRNDHIRNRAVRSSKVNAVWCFWLQLVLCSRRHWFEYWKTGIERCCGGLYIYILLLLRKCSLSSAVRG